MSRTSWRPSAETLEASAPQTVVLSNAARWSQPENFTPYRATRLSAACLWRPSTSFRGCDSGEPPLATNARTARSPSGSGDTLQKRAVLSGKVRWQTVALRHEQLDSFDSCRSWARWHCFLRRLGRRIFTPGAYAAFRFERARHPRGDGVSDPNEARARAAHRRSGRQIPHRLRKARSAPPPGQTRHRPNLRGVCAVSVQLA